MLSLMKREKSIVAFERIEKAKEQKKANSGNKNIFKQKKEYEKQHRKLRNQVQRLESELEKQMEVEKELEVKMADPNFYNTPSFNETVAQHKKVQSLISDVESEWEEAMLNLESLEDPELN